MTCYVGLDVSLAETSVCVLEEDGRVRFEGRVPSQPEPMIKCLREKAGDAQRIGKETGPTAGVLFRAIQSANLPLVCLETRHAHRVLSARSNKTDRNDARGLAELMRVGWFRAAWVRGAFGEASSPGRKPGLTSQRSWRTDSDPRGCDIEAVPATDAHVEAAALTSEGTLCPAVAPPLSGAVDVCLNGPP
jgi:hypothetical protein